VLIDETGIVSVNQAMPPPDHTTACMSVVEAQAAGFRSPTPYCNTVCDVSTPVEVRYVSRAVS
jgi:hypothetical protein